MTIASPAHDNADVCSVSLPSAGAVDTSEGVVFDPAAPEPQPQARENAATQTHRRQLCMHEDYVKFVDNSVAVCLDISVASSLEFSVSVTA